MQKKKIMVIFNTYQNYPLAMLMNIVRGVAFTSNHMFVASAYVH